MICCGLIGLLFAAMAMPSGENAPRNVWTLSKDAERLVAEMREQAKAYRPRTDHVGLFSRAQLKYSAHRTDFIHRWYERPLHQDSTWAELVDPRRTLQDDAWKKTAETVKLSKLDGLAVCITQSGRGEVIEKSVMPGGETKILVELPYAYNDKGLESYVQSAGRALAMPNSYRIDGKVVLTRYPAVPENQLDFCDKVRKALAERYGPGKFIVIYYVSAFEKGVLPDAGPLTAAALEKAREHLRRCLRKMDGLFMAGWEVYWPRRYGADFERDVLVPLYQSVLAEPEFAGRKYLGMPMTPGHENCYRWSYSIDSQGTRTLVERMETMRTLRPDFIICCEWDEENENTHFRPTLSNGFVHQRILRYFADAFAGRAPEVFPGDDTSVPNLVVAYRKSLIAGEPIEVDVRNIPDGTFADQKLSVAFRWLNADGKPVKTYPPQTLATDEAKNVFFISPASELVAANRVLLPELVVSAGGKRWRFGSDFWPLDLNATRALDTKWAKHALRERSRRKIAGRIAVSEAAADGTYRVSGSFSAAAPVRSVEVLEGPDTIFMYDPKEKEEKDSVVIKLEIQAHPDAGAKGYKLNGSIRYADAKGVRIITRGRHATDDGWTFQDGLYSNWDINLFARVPIAALETAVIDVDLPPIFKRKIRVMDIVQREVVSLTGPAGGNLVMSRYLSQIKMPEPCRVKDGAFDFTMKPVSRSSVLRLQIVDGDYHVWRGAPIVLETPAKELRTFHVYERDERRVSTVKVDACRADEPTYTFGGGRGAVAWSPLGRAFCGLFGGATSLVTGFGEGETCYGDSVKSYVTGSEGEVWNSAPKRVRGPNEQGVALAFDGNDYVTLPQQLAPKFAGFAIALDVCPEAPHGKFASLVDAGFGAYKFFLRDGVPEFRYNGRTYRGAAPLPLGAWSHLEVVFDQQTVTIGVNGKTGESRPCTGYMSQARYTAVGAANRGPEFFRGKIANLSFKLR